jgi:predicted nucleic acid-binding protein
MKVVLDSTVIFSIFHEKDPFHHLGMEIFNQFMSKKIEVFLPTLAMPEVCGAMKRETKDYKISMIVQSQLEGWIENNIISVKDLTTDRMKYATEDAIEFGLKGADAVFVALAKEMDAKLATFDGNLKDKIKRNIKLFEIEK